MIPIEKKIIDTLLADSDILAEVAGNGTVGDPYSIFLWDKRNHAKKNAPALFAYVTYGPSEPKIPASRGNVRFLYMQNQASASYAKWARTREALKALLNRNEGQPLTEINGDSGTPLDSIKVHHILSVNDDYEYEVGELISGVLDFEFVIHDNDDVYTELAAWT